MTNDGSAWIDQAMLTKLEKLALVAKSKNLGMMQGQRRSKRMGTSLEFADFREYSPGDDFRLLDWNVYGRTGKPFIKLFLDEQELLVNLLIDSSKSMGFGAGADSVQGNKFVYAKQLAACVGYIALVGYDRVSAGFFSDAVHERLPLLRGRGSAQRLFQFLADGQVRASGHLAQALMHPSTSPGRGGMTWIFSDMWYEEGVAETISYLKAAGQDVVVVHVLSQEEVTPKLAGDLRLIDSEQDTGIEVAMSKKVLNDYEQALQQHVHQLQRMCYERDVAYVNVMTQMPLIDTVYRLFRQSGVVM